MKRHTIIAAMLLAILVGSGCPPTHTEPIIDMRPKTEAARQFEARWQASLKVLRSYRFKIDRQDRRSGLIKSEPMMARYLFEFWRSDASSAYELLEGTMHTIYVIASVNVTRVHPDGDDYTLDVVVNRVRSNQVEAQDTGSTLVFTGGARGWRGVRKNPLAMRVHPSS